MRYATNIARTLTSVIDWRRALLMVPILGLLGFAIYFFAVRNTTGSTPRATLLEMPRGTSAGSRKGDRARDFQGYSPDGVLISLASLRGRPAIINFWATWCASCAAELPDLRDLQAELGPDNVSVLAVNVGEGRGTARKFLKAVDADEFDVVMDPTLVVADAYGVHGMPQTFFVDADGVIRATYVGQLSPDVMRGYVQAASAGSDATEVHGPLRLITTVARDHVLEVRTVGPGQVELRSKSLRCDDFYCASEALDVIASEIGLRVTERHLARDPPSVVLQFDESQTTVARMANAIAERVVNHDPLYERPVNIVYK